MKNNQITKIKTLGALRDSGYGSLSVKDEMRANLIQMLEKGEKLFPDIFGYEETVIPDIERAILARHNINFLGLRGQAKTRMARSLVGLLDEYLPVLEGTEINDDPFNPISKAGQELIKKWGNDTPVSWIHRRERYAEKLATPDVTVADLIGDVDPVKAANLKLSYADERVIHFGLIPRSNRGIFVINELPDLQPRIQVSLFNILQEGDIQIRGFKLRLPLDVVFIFTANPEDYTNRGSIITPLKDRIQSQILTHYPKSIDLSSSITKQEARLTPQQKDRVKISDLMANLVEQIAFEARNSDLIDKKSGVSARLTISAYEMLTSAVELRVLKNKEKEGSARIGDIQAIIPAITGKVELVYEGEQEGMAGVAENLIEKAIRTLFVQYFPDPELARKKKNEINPYDQIINWFRDRDLELPSGLTEQDYQEKIKQIPNLENITGRYLKNLKDDEKYLFMEFILHGLASFSMLSKYSLENGITFSDLFNSMFSSDEMDEIE